MNRTPLILLLLSACLVVYATKGPAQETTPVPLSKNDLSQEINKVLDDENLAALDRIRRLRVLLETQEALIVRHSIVKWVDLLGDASFERREEAEAKIQESEALAIPLLEQNASDDDLERASRCLEILVRFAEGKDDTLATPALQAIERISKNNDSRVSGRAAKKFDLLSLSDRDRAIRALEDAGARIYQSRDGHVRSITVFGDGFDDADMKLLKHLPSVSSLSLTSTRISDAGLVHLAEMPALSSITIVNSSVTDSGLETIASLKQIESVSLSGWNFTSRGLSKLHEMQNLRSLHLMGLRLAGDTVDVLTALQSIQHLALSLRKVDDRELKQVSRLPRLAFLNIDDSPNLTDEGISTLQSLRLRNLSIDDCQVSDEGLRHLSGIVGLESLSLASDLITNKGLAQIAKLRSLRMLSLSSATVTDDGLRHLGELGSLSYLTLRGCSITDAGIKHIAELNQLRRLRFKNTEITSEGVKAIRSALPGCSVSY